MDVDCLPLGLYERLLWRKQILKPLILAATSDLSVPVFVPYNIRLRNTGTSDVLSNISR